MNVRRLRLHFVKDVILAVALGSDGAAWWWTEIRHCKCKHFYVKGDLARTRTYMGTYGWRCGLVAINITLNHKRKYKRESATGWWMDTGTYDTCLKLKMIRKLLPFRISIYRVDESVQVWFSTCVSSVDSLLTLCQMRPLARARSHTQFTITIFAISVTFVVLLWAIDGIWLTPCYTIHPSIHLWMWKSMILISRCSSCKNCCNRCTESWLFFFIFKCRAVHTQTPRVRRMHRALRTQHDNDIWARYWEPC